MAERSFTNEVRKLRLSDGEVFHGEEILAVTKALLQSIRAPISHLMDVLTDANQFLEELGVHFEHSDSEATAAAAPWRFPTICGRGSLPILAEGRAAGKDAFTRV
jgi:indolepyruvate ferredoxin oxidoreductase alpha subunit